MSAFTEPAFAWEPITPRGVAAFARASFERLFVVQAVVALLAAAAVVWTLSDGIFPTIDAAIAELPDAGEIHSGKLDWRDDSPMLLAEGRILAFSVDLEHGGALRSPADFQFEFGRDSVRVFSLFGETEVNYPPGYLIAANQTDARPVWGAWAPDILGLAAIGVFFGLLLVWAVLATLYFLPVWLVCLFSNRDLNFRASWKLAGAALMPGALLLALSLVLYELGGFDILQLCLAFGLHLIIGWIYLFLSPMFLNRVLPPEKQNPFVK
ncbi:MAG: hypothetical protein ABSH48_28415 [Verrucomicrobiota bacterium]|jgi:hypothetical protein